MPSTSYSTSVHPSVPSWVKTALALCVPVVFAIIFAGGAPADLANVAAHAAPAPTGGAARMANMPGMAGMADMPGMTAAAMRGGPAAQSVPASKGPPALVEVTIQNYAFTPQNITVQAGDTVRWTNLDADRHTVTSDNGTFDSGEVGPNGTFEFTFTVPGTFPYHCARHSPMTGTITVLAGAGGTATPSPAATGTANVTTTPGATRTADTTPTATPGAGCATGSTAAVSIGESGFRPASVAVTAGTRVTWTNTGTNRHRVRDAGHNLFDSDDLNPGESFTYTFCAPGTYAVEDARSTARGTVVVQGGPGVTTTPGATRTEDATRTPGATRTEDATTTPGATHTAEPAHTTAPQVTGTTVINSVDVAIQRMAFTPQNLTIPVGTTVRWTNQDPMPHTVSSNTGVFGSGLLNPGQSYSFTFATPGDYAYHCAIHTDMTAVIHVVAAASTPAPSRTAAGTTTPVAFGDVGPADYFYTPVTWLVSHGAVAGYADGTFRPYNQITRGQITKVLVLAQGWALAHPAVTTFSDVPAGSAFFPYVETALAHGIISGYADGTFHPNANVTRGQIAKIVALARGWALLAPPAATFSDVPAGSVFFLYVETAVHQQVLSGYADGTFRPASSATRGQASKIIYNAVTSP